MKEKDIKTIVETLNPHWEKIDTDYKIRAKELKDLLHRNHDEIGMILKMHLIVEHYLTQNLEKHYIASDIDEVRLSFFQKANLIPKTDVGAQWLKPGILELNRIRNKYAHNLNADLKYSELIEIKNIVKVSRDISHNSISRLLKDFVAVCGAFLGKADPEVVKIFEDAFKKTKHNIG